MRNKCPVCAVLDRNYEKTRETWLAVGKTMGGEKRRFVPPELLSANQSKASLKVVEAFHKELRHMMDGGQGAGLDS